MKSSNSNSNNNSSTVIRVSKELADDMMNNPDGTADMLFAFGVGRQEANKVVFSWASKAWLARLKNLVRSVTPSKTKRGPHHHRLKQSVSEFTVKASSSSLKEHLSDVLCKLCASTTPLHIEEKVTT